MKKIFGDKHISSNRIETTFNKLDSWSTFTGNFKISSVDRDVTLFLSYDNWKKHCLSLCKQISSKIRVKPCLKMFSSQFTFNRIITT